MTHDSNRCAPATARGAAPVDVVDEVLARIAARRRPRLDLAAVDATRSARCCARSTARDAERLPLYGVPFAVKDNIDVAGAADHRRLSGRSPIGRRAPRRRGRAPARRRRDADRQDQPRPVRHRPGRRALALRRLRAIRFDAGDDLRRLELRLGGRRGAPAWSSFALGTDTAGSGRVPAAFNNIVGLKPTRGLISTSGVVPACRSLDCVSIFALTVADAADRCCAPSPASTPPIRTRGRRAARRRAGRAPVPLRRAAAAQREFFGNAARRALFAARRRTA